MNFPNEDSSVKKTYLIHDIVWISFAFLVCLGGLKLGFGSFHQPHAGFMPFLSGLVLGLLALVDLISGVANHWKQEKADKEIWPNIHWGKLFLTLILLFIYTILFNTLGFIIATIPLLFFLYRLMEPRPWWVALIASVITTGLFYLGFKVGLDSQLPQGFLGF
ncbi:MAG: tripartite tricarboxylate transporter TctB family protein [Deltaproteobacteria bacterium]|nr:MAG: tripartite tricarboxylate transporter TctB family protein [Deltaproteobacteria bacterium]